ncbi:MAG: hypothetical protein L0H63_16000 [Nitrococcus sp.]|nr:hypothetical protein [Nitrococcus sp.]
MRENIKARHKKNNDQKKVHQASLNTQFHYKPKVYIESDSGALMTQTWPNQNHIGGRKRVAQKPCRILTPQSMCVGASALLEILGTLRLAAPCFHPVRSAVGQVAAS